MDILTSRDGGRLILQFVGELDHHAAKEVMGRADALLDKHMPRECDLELSRLGFMDSSGIAVILRLHKRMRDVGGRLRVCQPGEQPLRVLEISGVERLVPVITTKKEQNV